MKSKSLFFWVAGEAGKPGPAIQNPKRVKELPLARSLTTFGPVCILAVRVLHAQNRNNSLCQHTFPAGRSSLEIETGL